MSEQYQELQDRLDSLEKKIDYIVKILGIKSFEVKEKSINSNLSTQALENQFNTETPPPIPKNAIPAVASSATANLLPILAVICFGLAGVFIVKLAIESGWLTAERQWGLLALFGMALVVTTCYLRGLHK